MTFPILLGLFLAGSGAEGAGHPHESRITLSFDQAIGLSDQTATVRAAKDAVKAKSALNQQISTINQNPQLWARGGYRFAPTNDREPEFNLQWVQPWIGGGYSQARRNSAQLEHGALQAQARAVALAKKMDVAHAWLQLWAMQQQARQFRVEHDVALAMVKAVQTAQRLGASTEVDVVAAEEFAAEVWLAVVDADGNVHDLSLELARRMNRKPSGEIETTGAIPLPEVPPPDKSAGFVSRAADLPQVVQSRLTAAAAHAQLVEQTGAASWSYAAGVDVERDAPQGLVVSSVFWITPPLMDRSERLRGSTAAAAAQQAGIAEDVAHEAARLIAMGFHDVEHAGETLQAIESRLIPAATRLGELRRKQFAVGSATVFEVLQAQQRLLLAQRRLHEARAQNAWARVKLWLLLANMEPSAGTLEANR